MKQNLDIDAYPSKAVFYSFRLKPDQELISELRKIINSKNVKAGFIAGAVGSLSETNIRFAGRPNGTLLKDKFEVVSLIGTLDQNGEHLHITISDENGKVIGGHILEGCIVRTTMELVIGVLPSVEFTREPCEISGYKELVVREV